MPVLLVRSGPFVTDTGLDGSHPPKVGRGLLERRVTDDMLTWQAAGGFSIDASVHIAGHDRAGLERLLRYCAHRLEPASGRCAIISGLIPKKRQWRRTIRASGDNRLRNTRPRENQTRPLGIDPLHLDVARRSLLC